MDSIIENNTNAQTTILQTVNHLDAQEQQQTVPVKPEKPKQTYKCLVCGKS